MSAHSLEEGEIPSEAPTPERSPSDLNDELLIDQIVHDEKMSSARRIKSPEEKAHYKSNRQERRRSRARKNDKNEIFSQAPVPPFEHQTSWHTNGSGSQAPRRPAPPESVVFGITQNRGLNQNLGPPQQPQNIRPFDTYPPGINRYPLHYFQSGPFHDPRPLMSIPYQFSSRSSIIPPPPMPPLPPPPPMLPLQPPPFRKSSYQSISPTPLPATFDDNYEQTCMNMESPDEPQTTNSTPPVEIPLEATAAVPPEQFDDENTLRAMLLSQLNQNKKRNAEQKPVSPRKRARTISKSKLSTSVETLFDAKKIVSPPPPVPKIEVNIAKKKSEEPPEAPAPKAAPAPAPKAAPAPAPKAAPAPEAGPAPKAGPKAAPAPEAAPGDSPESPPPAPPPVPTEVLTREARKAHFQLKLFEVTKKIEEQRAKVEEASRNAKKAAQMAKQAAEMARQAEEMNRTAMEMREKCIEDSKVGKEEMRTLLMEKSQIQNNLDMMTVDDLDDVDVEEFPEIIISSVRRSVGTPILKKEEPPTAENSFVDQGNSPEKEAPASNTSTEDIRGEQPMDVEEEVEGEDEYEEEDEVFEAPAVKPKESVLEQVLRQRLMNKMTRTEKSPENVPPVVSSSSAQPEEHIEECRSILFQMCKFELNGKCERPRDCAFLHLRDINDREQQTHLLESLFRDVFQYNEADIEPAITQTLHFLPEFQQFEKLMEQFFKVVIHQTPDYKNKLFTFYATAAANQRR